MDVYFVRHGETAYNRCHIHQSPVIALSEHGREQALTIAEELRQMNPTLLFTSEYQRTKETAGIIGNMLGLTPVVSTLFHEVRRPSELYGRSHYHPRTLSYVCRSVLNRNRSKWRTSDAENFADVRTRIASALTLLESYGKEHKSIIVVSHTIFINLMVAYMCNNRDMSLRKLLPYLFKVVRMGNTEITHIKHVIPESPNSCEWVRGA